MKAKVYRSGPVSAPVTRGVETDSYCEADTVRPAGRQGRTTGIFASPTLAGVVRWTHANASLMKHPDPFVREITVDPESVYVYSIKAWEKCSWTQGSSYEEYWKSGVTLKEWFENADEYNADEWELLLSSEDVLSTRNVSDSRVLKSTLDEYLNYELSGVLKSARHAAKFA